MTERRGSGQGAHKGRPYELVRTYPSQGMRPAAYRSAK